MTKSDAIKIFGKAARLAEAIGVTPSAVSQWGEELSQQQADRILGAAVRVGQITPHDAEQIGRQMDRQNA